MLKTANHHAGAGQQNQCQRSLGSHQERRHSPSLDSLRGATSGLRHGCGGITARQPERGYQAEDQARRHRHPDQVYEHPVVHGEVHGVIEPIATDSVRQARPGRTQREEPDTESGDPPPDESTERRQQQAFQEQLADDAPSAGAKCHSHPRFAASAHAASKQQVRHVRAGDQENTDHGREHGLVDPRGVVADEELVELLHLGHKVSPLIGEWVRLAESSSDRLHLCASALYRCVGAQARGDEPQAAIPTVAPRFGRRNQRYPQIGVLREGEAVGHDADDRGRVAVNAHCPADHKWILAVASLPERMPQDGDTRRARLLIGRQEVSAHDGCLPGQSKGTRANL
jgi:hypothetical protein